MRTVLGGRISTAALSGLHPTGPKPSFQKQPARLASLLASSLTRMNETTPCRPSIHVQTCSRPQSSMLALPVLRTTFRANSTSSSAPRTGAAQLDWNSFFKLRASRRRYSVASSVATSVVTTVLGVQYLSTQDIESLGAQVMGLDPFVVLGMATMACGAAGWLLGPFVGNGVWSLVNRKFTASFTMVGFSSIKSCVYSQYG